MDARGKIDAHEGIDLTTVEATRNRLVEQTRQMRTAAEAWGLRHDTPEGSLTVDATAAISALIDDFGADLDRRRQTAQASVDQMAASARDAGEFVGKLRAAVDRVEMVKNDMPARIASLLAVDVGRAL